MNWHTGYHDQYEPPSFDLIFTFTRPLNGTDPKVCEKGYLLNLATNLFNVAQRHLTIFPTQLQTVLVGQAY